MGYKISENDLAANFNYRLAMYKGEPVQLLAVQQNSGYNDYGRTYIHKLYGGRPDCYRQGLWLHLLSREA